MSRLNINETQCANFEARFCCPSLSVSETSDLKYNEGTEPSYTDVYNATIAMSTTGYFAPTESTQEYLTTSFEKTTDIYGPKRWSFEEFNLTEPESLNELRNFMKPLNKNYKILTNAIVFR